MIKNCKNKMLENKANNADFFSKSVLGTKHVQNQFRFSYLI